MPQTCRTFLKSLHDQGLIEPFAWHFAETVSKLAPGGPASMPDHLFLAAALTAQNTIVHKHVCLTLTPDLKIEPLLSRDNLYGEVDTELAIPADLAVLLKSAACSFAVADGAGESYKPLILEDNRLYLQRYWVCENLCAADLRSRARAEPAAAPEDSVIRALTRLELDTDQIAAIRQAVSGKFCVITGSPGTGKTTIVGVVLALLLQKDPRQNVCLCAPTGKAQARLKEALDGEVKNNLTLAAADPARASLEQLSPLTIHRLLRINPVTGACGHNRDNPLLADTLVVDEVSMVDLPLLVKLLDAIPQGCRLILLGDKDQLAAVETGAALVEMCEAWQDRPPVALLTRSHRFPADSGIGRLKDAVNRGAAVEAWEIMSSADAALDVAPPPTSNDACARALAAYLSGHPFRAYLQAETAAAALELFNSFRILCATRCGPCGVDTVNHCVQNLLGVKTYGHGYPIMVTVNDYARRLFNGDIGICLKDPKSGAVRVWFPDLEKPGAYRSFGIAELPGHAPVFAMTVHKAQGSGFGEVLLILPPQDNPVLTRELVYTGVTRARTRCAVWAARDIFEKCVRTPTRRMSGLKAKLQS
ncbi:MAG: exodeoxyribonuclease V subunit alpha [Kiritimatiellae bacterium]|nr:exodeoxyribonuclease V subunit alpha [Kiritimatiellia bacterium]